MKRIKIFGVIFCFIISMQMVKAQGLSYEEYTAKDGLPSMQTYNIVQDSFGILWIGTENGLVSYDGDEFVRYSHPDLIDNDIIKVIKTSKGTICLLNLSGQLGYIVNNEIKLIDISDVPEKIINIITWNNMNYLIVAKFNFNRSYELIEKPDQSFEFNPTNFSLFNEDEKKVYTRTKIDEWKSIYDTSFLVRGKIKHSLTFNKKVYQLTSGHYPYEIYEVDQSLQKYFAESIYSRYIKHGNDFYIIRDNETVYYDSKLKSFTSFLSNVKVNTIFFDMENNAWCSTYNKGLLKISNPLFKLKQKQANLNYGVADIYQDKNGNIYLGTLTSDIIINPLGNVKKIKVSPNQRPIQFYENGDKVIGFDDHVIFEIDCNSLDYQKKTKFSRIQKSILVTNDIIYIVSATGVFVKKYDQYLNDISYTNINTNRLLKGTRVQKIHKQKETKQIFVGTTNGLAISVKDTFDFVENDKLKSASISCIIDGENKSIWVGTKTEGIYNLRNDSILYHYNNTNGLISNNINNIEIHESELIVSTASGLTIIDLFNNTSKVINENNYLTSNKVYVCKVIEGKYWIGTENGLTILTKEEINRSTTARPLLSLKKLYINGMEKEYISGMELSHNSNNVQLSLQNIYYSSGRDKKIKYRIPLIDSSWILTTDPNLRLPSLKPGKYVIEATGINSIGIESRPLNLFFTINRPWWETIWARMLGALMFISFTFFIFQYRIKQEKQKRNYLTQINNIKDQALQLQMNPHFIFISLNAIQGFIGTDDEEMAMNYLARFARLIRLIFEHSKGTTITLEEELEFINLYLDLEKLRFKDKVNIEMIIDSEVENTKDILSVPPLLIQPIIENSFKHGLFHKKDKGNLKIEYTIQNEILKVVIEDDGIGREESSKIIQKNLEKTNFIRNQNNNRENQPSKFWKRQKNE